MYKAITTIQKYILTYQSKGKGKGQIQGTKCAMDNKKAVLSQGNRAIPQLFFSV